MSLKNQIRKLMRFCGVDIVKYDSKSHPLAKLINLLKEYKINLVFDVGANVGQYGLFLRDLGYNGRIISLEPLSSAFSELQKKARRDRLWDCENIGLGNSEGKTIINISDNSQSSSILDMLPLHYQSAPESIYIGKEGITLSTGDLMMNKYYRDGDIAFLKIDSQGYEKKILDGAQSFLNYIVGIELEMSFLPLYKDEVLFPEMINYIYKKGYTLMSLEPVFFSQSSGQLLQVNGLFFRLNR